MEDISKTEITTLIISIEVLLSFMSAWKKRKTLRNVSYFVFFYKYIIEMLFLETLEYLKVIERIYF